MANSRTSPATIQRYRTVRRRPVGVLAVAVVAIAAALGLRSTDSSSLTPAQPSGAALPSTAFSPAPSAPPGEIPRGEHLGGLGEDAGAVPDGTTVFDDGVPGVANLDPGLLDALRRAATDAGNDGVELLVDSGWRSPEYQNQLLLQAVAEYGSEEEAARWVATPERSLHVSGDAVDIGPPAAAEWLSAQGAAYGLCRIYGNEPWHFELRPEAPAAGCPAMYADPTEDPRMQQ